MSVITRKKRETVHTVDEKTSNNRTAYIREILKKAKNDKKDKRREKIYFD